MVNRVWPGVPALVAIVALSGCGTPGADQVSDRVRVSVSPASVTLAPGEAQQFEAEVQGASDSAVTWQTTGGSLDGSGTTVDYTAPTTAGAYDVTATSVEDPDRSATAAVTVDEPTPAAGPVLDVHPSSVTLTGAGERATLSARGFDATGEPIPADELAIEWRVSEETAVDLVPDPDDPGRATVIAADAVGSAVIVAAATSQPDLVSRPVGVSVARLKGDVARVSDDAVAFPFLDVTPDADLDTAPPPGYEGSPGDASVHGFGEHEIADLLSVTDGLLRFPAIVLAEPPSIGQLVLGTGESALMGRVVDVETRGDVSLLQLEQVALRDVFDDYVFTFDSIELERQGLLSGSSWSGAPSPGTLAPAAAWLPDASACEVSGGLAPADVTATLANTVTPFLDTHVRLAEDRFRFNAGVRVRVTAELGLDLQGGLSGKVSCDVGPPLDRALPIPAGPLAAFLSAQAVVQPTYEVSFGASAGPDFGVSGTTSVETLIQAGFDANGASFENLSRLDVEPDADVHMAAGTDWGDMSWQMTLGKYASATIGIQLGGTTLERTCSVVGILPAMGSACEEVEQALFLGVLEGSVGGELQGAWDSRARVVANRSSESHLGTAGVATVALRNEALNRLLQRFGFAPRSIELARGQLDGPTLYRVFHPDGLDVASTNHEGPFEVGDTLDAVLGETVRITATGVYEPAVLAAFDTPLESGELWSDPSTEVAIDASSPVGEDALRIDLPVTAALCSEAAEAPVPLHVLGLNRMAGTIPTPGYLGSLGLTCDPLEYSGTFELNAILDCPELPSVDSLEYRATGTAFVAVSPARDTASAYLDLTEDFGPSCFTHRSGPFRFDMPPTDVQIQDDSLSLAFSRTDDARSYDMRLEGPVDGPLTGTIDADYFFIGQNGSGSTSITLDRLEGPP